MMLSFLSCSARGAERRGRDRKFFFTAVRVHPHQPHNIREEYLDGELCGVGPDGITSFSIVQLASDSGNAAASSSSCSIFSISTPKISAHGH
jgi:hypothetical protein